MAGLELFQELDAFRSVGVRAEQDIRLRDQARKAHLVVEFLVGVNHVELCDVAALHGGKSRIVGNLPQGRCQCQRVTAKLGAACVGDVFALARDSEARERAEEIPDSRPHEQHNQDEDDTRARAIVFAATTTSWGPPHVSQQAAYHIHEHREYAHENDADHHQARIAVLDVREFVPHHGGKFRIVQPVDDSRGKRDGIGIDIYPARKRVEARILHDVYLGHLDSARDAEVLDDVVDAHVLLAFKRARMRGVANNRGVREISDDKPDDRHSERKRHRVEEIPPDDIPMERGRLEAGFAHAVPAEIAEPVEQHDSPENHPQEDDREHKKQNNRIAVIPPNLGLNADVFHREARTSPREPCSGFRGLR